MVAPCSGKLKDLKFEYARARVLSIEHFSRVLIEWKLAKTTQNLTNLRFFVDRGVSPDDMKPISWPPLPGTDSAQEYVDHTPKMIDLEKVYYYRIRAVEYSNTTPVQTFESAKFSWDGDLDLVGLYVVEEHLFEFRYVDGAPVMIFKKMTEGARCATCWDPVMKRVTKSNCTECHGTGYTGGGYYQPMPGWCKFEPDPNLVQIADFGEKQVEQTDMMFTNYPALSVGDIVVELKPNRYWRVANSRFTEKNRAAMLQISRLDEINRSDIEYDLRMDEEIRAAMVKEFDDRKKTPEF